MAYDPYQAERVRRSFKDRKLFVEEKQMFGGLCFMLDGKMCCGLLYSKKRSTDLLMARVGPEAYDHCLEHKGAHPMDFTGRAMKGFVFVSPEGFDSESDLSFWIEACIAYNPEARSSKKGR